jgi:BirA family transcriptional regulator, biotin operon repressor / biotin---[acetyl-CoA-carboxylase] ligase
LSAETGWPDGVGRVVLEACESTNSEAIRRAPGLDAPCWILAYRQTGGRGRRGRVWHDPEGNFAASLVMRPVGPASQSALRSFTASLALFDALVAATGQTGPFALKWPNDVLLNDGKLAGILLESVSDGRGVAHLVIGFGVNLISAPAAEPGAMRPVSLLEQTGCRIGPEAFLDLLAPAFARWEAQFQSFGFGHVRTAWLARAARRGQTVEARIADERVSGIFENIDDHGAIVLATPKGRRSIPAADIHFT